MPDMLVFTHIPRTGGTTFRKVISKFIKNYVYIDSFSSFSFMNDVELNSYSFIATHCGYGIFNRISKPHKKIVILRDPEERIISHYYYLRNLEENISYSSYYAKVLSFQQFIESEDPAINIGIHNTQTWHIIKDKNNYFRNEYKGIRDEELLEIAIDNLGKYDFVGFTDDLPTLLSEIGREYGWTGISQDIPFMRTSERPNIYDIGDGVQNSIRDRVGLDLLLYRRARQMVRDKKA